MGIVIDPLPLNSAFPVVRMCLTARIVQVLTVRATYPTRCGMKTCVNTPDLCSPQHDTRQVVIDFVDSSGVPFDVSSAPEITFTISRTVKSAALITKKKSDGSLVLTNNTQGRIDLSSVETGGLPLSRNYYECRVATSGGEFVTVLSGNFYIQDTLIGDAP